MSAPDKDQMYYKMMHNVSKTSKEKLLESYNKVWEEEEEEYQKEAV